MKNFMDYLELNEIKSMTDAMMSMFNEHRFNVDGMKKLIKSISEMSTQQKEMFSDRYDIDLDEEMKHMKKAIMSLDKCKLHNVK